ncbi:MAG: DNA repair protein RecN [Chitinophagaceae bacterium]|nr:DNA repair protein RecN [Chitinophagaceae bacterium]MCZ2397519.1 DNA repair protein RecN [Chitinophagales bacterium]
MLQQLDIKNYAIIDSLSIQFAGNLNIITGETGAGKSILMGALSLVLGDRAESSMLLDKEKKCVIEALFNDRGQALKSFLRDNELDAGDEVIVRREIMPNGKSRAFINDTPASLTQLKELSSFLVDLHRQFDTLDLNKKDFQLEVLDALAGNEDGLHKYQQLFADYKSLTQRLETLRDEQERMSQEADYNRFLFEELEKANFGPNEIEDLEAESRLISNAENIKSTLSEVLFFLNEGEDPMLNQLKARISRMASVVPLVPALQQIEERLQSSLIELKDISYELEKINDEISFNESHMATINTRLDLGYMLMKKHKVQTTAELLAIKEELNGKINAVADLTGAIERMDKEARVLLSTLKQAAEKISEARGKQIPAFSKKVNNLLGIVGMPNASFKVELTKREQLTESGTDEVEFLFNANKTTFQPVRKVASGGELSRLMLIIKSLIARSVSLPTLIFDEIDSGISGEASKQVANIIKELSNEHQIILITHQPQIAAKASIHFYVYKEMKGGRVRTGIKKLNHEEHLHAIATMLSGENPTAAAFENARELMN